MACESAALCDRPDYAALNLCRHDKQTGVGTNAYYRKFLCLFFVYSGAVSVPLAFWSDPNRDPNAEKLGGFIRTGKDTAVKFSERKDAEMPRHVR